MISDDDKSNIETYNQKPHEPIWREYISNIMAKKNDNIDDADCMDYINGMLYYATIYRNYIVIDLLLEVHADPFSNCDNSTSLNSAIMLKDTYMILLYMKTINFEKYNSFRIKQIQVCIQDNDVDGVISQLHDILYDGSDMADDMDNLNDMMANFTIMNNTVPNCKNTDSQEDVFVNEIFKTEMIRIDAISQIHEYISFFY